MEDYLSRIFCVNLQLWEMKMMQAGAILGPIERSSAARPTPGGPITPVHDLNVPYEGTEEYETPTADMLFPPVGHHLYNNMGCHKLARKLGNYLYRN